MITLHEDMMQGSDQWLQARRGMLTASEVPLILTPTLKIAANEKTRMHVYEIAAQRLTGHIEPHYIGDEMLRGYDEEILARDLYAKTFAPVQECGFITNNRLGFTMGCSPDGLVGDDGMLEIKSRRQKFQVQTMASAMVPDEHVMQVQAELFISERQWVDFISYSNGMPMVAIRAEPDPEFQEAIEAAAIAFEQRVQDVMHDYRANLSTIRNVPTVRREVQEMF